MSPYGLRRVSACCFMQSDFYFFILYKITFFFFLNIYPDRARVLYAYGTAAAGRMAARRARQRTAMVRRFHIKVRGLDPPEHQPIRPCTWRKFTMKYNAWFEIRDSKFEIINRPGESVLAKFRSLRPA